MIEKTDLVDQNDEQKHRNLFLEHGNNQKSHSKLMDNTAKPFTKSHIHTYAHIQSHAHTHMHEPYNAKFIKYFFSLFFFNHKQQERILNDCVIER